MSFPNVPYIFESILQSVKCLCRIFFAIQFLIVLTCPQIQARTGPTPAPSPLQRTASNSTWRLACTAAREKVPPGPSGRPTWADDPPTNPLAPTPESKGFPVCPVSAVAITAGALTRSPTDMTQTAARSPESVLEVERTVAAGPVARGSPCGRR